MKTTDLHLTDVRAQSKVLPPVWWCIWTCLRHPRRWINRLAVGRAFMLSRGVCDIQTTNDLRKLSDQMWADEFSRYNAKVSASGDDNQKT